MGVACADWHQSLGYCRVDTEIWSGRISCKGREQGGAQSCGGGVVFAGRCSQSGTAARVVPAVTE
jgi:hypothetical protein